jgi:3'(2'), 5'-bisphosphate nucleotidase
MALIWLLALGFQLSAFSLDSRLLEFSIMEMEVSALEFLGKLAKEAGKAILEVYETDFAVERKEDSSPLTLADRRSHQIITAGLQSEYPQIPVLSEEGKEVLYAARKGWPRFWLVDPLDGTKEFVKRNGEFTVNIALIEGTTPIMGVIYLPVPDRLFVADIRTGCREILQGEVRTLQVGSSSPESTVRVLKSRSHPSSNLEALLETLPSYESVTRGSALKFCAIAAGEADFYPRLGPTWEWDTAAGQAIVTAAGGVMFALNGEPFTYNKPNLVNGPFLVAANLPWLKQSGILDRAASVATQ